MIIPPPPAPLPANQPQLAHPAVCILERDGTVAAEAGQMRRALARRIHAWRQHEQWTLEALAAHLGVAASTINLWEHGKRTPSLDHLVALAHAMRQSPCRLLCPVENCPLSSLPHCTSQHAPL